jgi:hypothetical protein
MNEQRKQELQRFLNNLDWAEHNDLELEWLNSFFEDYASATSNILESMAYASREWDL